MGVGAVVWQGMSSVGIGIGCGVAEFIWHTLAQKVTMVVGQIELKESVDPDDGPRILSFEALDKRSFALIKGAVLEEIVFRGILQNVLKNLISSYFPEYVIAAGLSQVALLSIVITAVGFGALHYPEYEKGGAFAATMASIAGVVFGIVKEKWGLTASIAAHVTTNLSTAALDKYWPEFLEFPEERRLRLLPPKERQEQLLNEAVERAETAFAEMSQGSDKTKLTRLVSEWKSQLKELTSLQK